MARTVRSSPLETRAARLRLKPRDRPYYTAAGLRGLHLGYRRLENHNGSWVRREYAGESGSYATETIAQADDYSDADGGAVLDYFQALKQIGVERSKAPAGAYTVQQAVDEYVKWMRRERKSALSTEGKLRSYVTPALGDRVLAQLTKDDFSDWLDWALKHKPRGRQTHGRSRLADRPQLPQEERARRKRATLNRVINALKGALNRAFELGRCPSDAAWSGLQRFAGVDQSRTGRLTTEEAGRLINAAGPGFRQLVQAALLTGCRYGELCELRAGDYDARSRTITVRAATAKSGKARRVPLTAEGQALFDSLAAGKASDERLLQRADGSPWTQGAQRRPMIAACEAAGLPASFTFHGLRHSYASLLVEAGTPLAFVAEALGHSDTRMVEAHYSHLAPNLIAETIRANLPVFGMVSSGKVSRLRK